MNIKHYYEKELCALQEEAHRFAKLYPDHAAALNLEKNKAQDPHVERLLEGCAFLTAKIHEMIDKESDHLPYQLIQRLWPQLSQDFPSICIVKASPLPGMQPYINLPKGTEFVSLPQGPEYTPLRFQTCSEIRVHPLVLDELSYRSDEWETLTFSFRVEGKYDLKSLDMKTLPIFIDCKSSKAQVLVQLLTERKTSISLFHDGKPFPDHMLRFKLKALDPEFCLNDQVETGLFPQQLLFEAFVFPEKTHYLELVGLDKIAFPERIQQFTLEVRAERLDHSYQFTREDIQLFAVPAINAFEMDLEPIVLDHKKHTYALSPDHNRPDSMSLLSVDSAKGTTELNLPPIDYQPLSKIIDPADPYFVLQWPPALSFNSPHLLKQSVSVKGRVCNGIYPRRYLRPSGLELKEKKLQSQIAVTNLHQPSSFYPRDIEGQSKNLLQVLRVQVEDLSSITQLQTLLNLMNRSSSESLSKKITSLKQLDVKNRALIKKGIFYQAHQIRIMIEDSAFSSASERYLFGSLLHAYFQASSAITTCIETELISLPSELSVKWLGPHE